MHGYACRYSYGIVMWEIVSRTPPFEEYEDLAQCTREEAKHIIALENRRPTIPEATPSTLENLIRKCWSREPRERPKFSAIVKELSRFNEWE